MNTIWYEDEKIDKDIILSSRVRLARNIEPYNFPAKLSDEDSLKMMKEATKAFLDDKTVFANRFQFLDLSNSDMDSLYELMEKHIISPEMVHKNSPKGVLTIDDESIAIMLCEEDHIRIQTIFPGNSLDESFILANQLDDFLSESLTYAFDKKYGYLTACPTNTGTGLRASFMLHLPGMDAASNAWQQTLPMLSKMGLTIRGIHGEGTKAFGNIYQLSNQITLGVTEEQILTNVKQIATQLINQENAYRKALFEHQETKMIDQIYRAYGTLIYAKAISVKEALTCLSQVRLGFQTGVLHENKPKQSIYQLMMNIQPALIKKEKNTRGVGNHVTDDEFRADYLKSQFTN